MGFQSLSGSVEELPEMVLTKYEAMFFERGWAVDEEEETGQHSRAFKKEERRAFFLADPDPFNRTVIML